PAAPRLGRTAPSPRGFCVPLSPPPPPNPPQRGDGPQPGERGQCGARFGHVLGRRWSAGRRRLFLAAGRRRGRSDGWGRLFLAAGRRGRGSGGGLGRGARLPPVGGGDRWGGSHPPPRPPPPVEPPGPAAR